MLSKLMGMIVLCALLLGVAGLGLAQPDPNSSFATYANYPTQLSVVLIPNGSGQVMPNCYQFGGAPGNATITVTLNDIAGNPVAGYPAAAVWLQTSLGGVVWCPYNWPPGTWPGYVNIADTPTNAAGQTRFTQAYFGGNHSQLGLGEVTEVWTIDAAGNPVKVNGTAPGGPPNSNLRIVFNSPDLNADGVVDLSDVVIFAGDYFGAYNYRSDFLWDGTINLPDLVWMATGMHTQCP